MNSHEKRTIPPERNVRPLLQMGGECRAEDGVIDASPHATTFIVRISQIDADPVTGIVERVRTGQKERFYGLEGINQAIARMVERERRARTSPDQGSGG